MVEPSIWTLAPAASIDTPAPVIAPKPKIRTLARCSVPPLSRWTPILPVPAPLIARLRNVTTALAPLITTPLTCGLRTDPGVPAQSIVIELLIMTDPKPPGSRQLISPPTAVFEIAPAKVLHGAVRLHGLTSSPTPETQVRVACANAAVDRPARATISAKRASRRSEVFMSFPLWCARPRNRRCRAAPKIIDGRVIVLLPMRRKRDGVTIRQPRCLRPDHRT